MIYKLSYPSKTLKGKITLSGSKSESNRVLVINYLSGNNLPVENLSDSEDTRTLQDLLSKIDSDKEFNVGHAGTCMRFLTSVFAITPGERILKGSDRMHERPIRVLVNALRELGADIEYLNEEGYPPIKVKGQSLSGEKVKLNGEISSQYISSLMMIAPYLKNGLEVEINGELVSRPYLEMTSCIIKEFGVVNQLSGSILKIESGDYLHRAYQIESDWSSASYWYEAAGFCDEVDLELDGLNYEGSLQADSVVKAVYSKLGVDTIKTENGVKLSKKKYHNSQLSEFDFTNCPDVAQTLACTSISFNSSFKLTGLKTLRIKETDRIDALENELNKIGNKTKSTIDSLVVTPSSQILDQIFEIDTYNDHRMAMSFAMLVFSHEKLCIKSPDVVVKSYSNFWLDLRSVGVKIEEIGSQ